MTQSSGHAKEPKSPFQCDQCDPTFSRTLHLKRRSLKHSKSRTFSCARCRKGFSRRDMVGKHERKGKGGLRSC
ncbi:hypothetical protein BC830DRAFT_1155370 [Chytriomyces sp. MP71]|nr:hypothetical protein BC830DRAFT_1155370 [Chytriomyces sp. MP71]